MPSWFLGRAKDRAAARLEAARAYERLVQIHYLNNAKIPSLHAAFRALNLLETVGECPELARSYGHATVFCGLLGMHGSARAHAHRARAMAEKVNEPSCTAYVDFVRGVYWVTVGEWEDAEKDLTAAAQITKQIGETRHWYESTFTLANALSRKGAFARSAAISEELHQTGTRHGVPQVQVWGLSWHIRCLLVLEPQSPQLGLLETALSACLAAHPTIPLADQILGYALLSQASWRRGEETRARKAADAAERIIRQTNQISHYLLPAYAGLAEVYMALWAAHQGDPEQVQEMNRRIRHLRAILRQFSRMYPIGRPRTWLVRGRYDWLRGRLSRARRAWWKSLAAAERYRMPYEQSQALEEIAGHLPVDDPARARQLARARELFQKGE
jgi:tetratricopeptide (TPR) repeat protein